MRLLFLLGQDLQHLGVHLFSRKLYLFFLWAGQDLQHLGVHLFWRRKKINLHAKFWHTSYVWNRINSLFRMHLLVLLRHDLQHLGVHLFFFFFQKPMYGVKRNRINSICRLHLLPFSQTSFVCFFYELDRIYSTWGCTYFWGRKIYLH